MRRMRSTLCWLPLLLALAATACAPPAPKADLVLHHGKLVTVDAQHPEAQAIAIQGDTIAAVGSDAEIAPWIGPQTKVIDLGGKLAIPGFVEGHGHFLSLGEAKMALDLTTAKSWDEIVEKVRQAAAKAQPGEWILGGGWHQDKWESRPEPNVEGFPVHAALSAAAPDNPVLLSHASGHAAFANAAAMAAGGVTAATPDPPGGEILRDAAGQPTGLFREEAEALVSRQGPPSEAELLKAIELASEDCLAKGVTSFQDAGSPVPLVDLYRRLAAEKKLRLRLWVMFRDLDERIAAALPSYEAAPPDEFFKAGGIKHAADGALGSRGAWLLAPYSDQPGSTGLNTTPIPVIEATAKLAIDHGLQLCVHAIGDRANRETLDLFARTFAAHPEKKDLRWRVEHAQHLDPADIPRFAQLGVIASMQAIHCTSDGPWVPARLGAERCAAGAYVWRQLLDSGAVVSNGTDAPVEDVDPIPGFYAAVTRQMKNGEAFYPAEKMTREEALKAYTLSAAYAAFQENQKGSLTAGKLADITVLSRDLMTIPEDEIPGTQVVMTIVGGKVAFERK